MEKTSLDLQAVLRNLQREGRWILPLEEALAKASGGAFAITREVPKGRTHVLNVPPLAHEEAADEDAVEEETAAPTVLA